MIGARFYVVFLVLCGIVTGLWGANAEESRKDGAYLSCNRDAALTFLRGECVVALKENRSFLKAFPVDVASNQESYRLQSLELGQEASNAYEQTKDEVLALIEKMINAIETIEDSSNQDFQQAMKDLFDIIAFIIAHIRFNICEIQYDIYRSAIGYYTKVDKAILDQYGIDDFHSQNKDLSISLYNKGKFSLLTPQNPVLVPVVKLVQYEESTRYQQLYHAIRLYVTWFYQIFGYNEETTKILQNLIESTENQFETHIKRFTLDHILRFKGNGFLQLLY